MICFYHDDLDGKASAAVVRYFNPSCNLIPLSHYMIKEKLEETIFLHTKEGEVVFLVDFCLPLTLMQKLNRFTILNWIDHHRTSINLAIKNNFEARGSQILKEGRGACELCWKKFSPLIPPRAIHLISTFDVGQKSENNINFNYGLESFIFDRMSPENNYTWEKLFFLNNYVNEIIKKGMAINRFAACMAEKKHFIEMYFDGLRSIVLNNQGDRSSFDCIKDLEKYNLMIIYYFIEKKTLAVKIYTENTLIDVSKIAESFGGGGHTNAAGFTLRGKEKIDNFKRLFK
jgi:oligoribonuclease NrnB/cAMP/cGMP phosphodiesterase (DHH superfamily)